ncbi:MAG: hypothetical protein HQL53_14120 [Magnetococcales bacterium]|nr:hypothetical protein [Magnetococcales bacterium]
MPDQIAKWTPKMVAERLEEAAATMKRLPPVGPRKLQSQWPTIIRDYWESYGYDRARVHLGPPSALAIQRMDESLEWLKVLEKRSAQLIWSRAERLPWKLIMRMLGVSRATAWRYWMAALTEIAQKLNQSSKHPIETNR